MRRLTLDALLGGCRLLQLVVGAFQFRMGHLQFLVSSGETLLGTTTIERINNKEGGEQYQRHQCAEPALTGE